MYSLVDGNLQGTNKQVLLFLAMQSCKSGEPGTKIQPAGIQNLLANRWGFSPLPPSLPQPHLLLLLLCLRDDNDGVLQLRGEHSVSVAQGEDGGAVLEGSLGREEACRRSKKSNLAAISLMLISLGARLALGDLATTFSN